MRTHFEILSQMLEERIIAIVRLDSAEHFLNVARALKAGGISVIEFTLTTPGALEMLKQVGAHFGADALIGAGTVLDPETAQSAFLAGAQFIVTPTFNPATVEMCKRHGKPVAAGALTPTEMLNAWQAGADLVKVFPVHVVGGPEYVRAVLAPLPQLRLVPTGGVNADNAAAYLKAGAVSVAVGGGLADRNVVSRAEWHLITAEARRLVAAVAG